MRTRLVFALFVIALTVAVAGWGGRAILQALTRQARARLRRPRNVVNTPQHPTIVQTRNAGRDNHEPHATAAPLD